MKILGINNNPQKNGNTVKLINEIFRGTIENTHHCEIIHLVDFHLDYCNWCVGMLEDWCLDL
ncbi:MAG: NAD(P)H-dependent oxidoreductase [Candidatus Hodarchaeota archaeon]